jgi:nicotinamide N-methyltransferase
MSDDEGEMGNMFEEPAGFRPPTPPPTCETHTLKSGQVIQLHLVGYSPTEAHTVWNGSRVVSDYFEADPSRVRGKTILEIGAAAGLPSLTAGVLGARRVVMSDYPDVDIVQTMQQNIDECDASTPASALVEGPDGKPSRVADRVVTRGYVWGADPQPLLSMLPEADSGAKFDILILADLMFRHSEHGNILKSVEMTMARKKTSVAYVFFTSYRPWLRAKDLAFFDLARERGFLVEQVVDRRLEKPLFENDPGDLEVQKTVSGFEVRWPDAAWEE